jgi:hypothetical protein
MMEAGTMNQTNVNDFQAGKRDRMAGYYDKWYRYNHNDNGAAYDAGVKAAVDDKDCVPYCTIIECDYSMAATQVNDDYYFIN